MDLEGLVSVEDFEREAIRRLPKMAADYYRSGATAELTVAENKAAFGRLRLLPRCMRDVSGLDMTTTVLGTRVRVPFGVSPTAMHKMAHPDGENVSARATGNFGTVFILSTIATSSIEEITSSAPDTIKWFQLYIYKDRKVSESLIRRAEKAGFKAIVLTVDAPFFGLRRSDVRNKFKLPPNLRFANFEGYMSDMIQKSSEGSGLNEYVSSQFDSSVTWQDVKWLKSITKLPLVIKGVLRTDDARMAVEIGADAIMVSNHGGRQLDGAPATIEVLKDIVDATKGSGVEIYLDGGVTQGTDVVKALSLGAKMVFVGRPILWGLACGGERGVEKILGILKDELESALALLGCSKVSELAPDLVVHSSRYRSRL